MAPNRNTDNDNFFKEGEEESLLALVVGEIATSSFGRIMAC
jgi:hypothetical protein